MKMKSMAELAYDASITSSMRLSISITPLNLRKKIPAPFWPCPFSWNKALMEPRVHGYPQLVFLPQKHSSYTWTQEFPAKNGPEPISEARADCFPGMFIMRADQIIPINWLLLEPRNGQERPVYMDMDGTCTHKWGYPHTNTSALMVLDRVRVKSEKKRESSSMSWGSGSSKLPCSGVEPLETWENWPSKSLRRYIR